MNTLTPVTPMNLYEEHRRDMDAKATDLNEFAAEIQAMIDKGAPSGAPSGEQKGAPSGAPSGEQKGAPSGAPFTAVPDKVIADAPSNRTVEDDKSEGWGSKLIHGIDWLMSPLIGLSGGEAALAPLSHKYKSDTFLGQVGEAFKVSGEALLKRLVPTYGQEIKDYGTAAVNTYAPNLPEAVKTTIGGVLNMAADPGTSLGLPMVKAIQQGLRVARDVSQATNVERGFKGLLQEGVLEMLSVGKGYDPAELTKIGQLAEKADAGDKVALKKLNDLLEKDRRAIESADQLDSEDVNNMLSRYKEVLGSTEAPAFTLVKDVPPEQLLKNGTAEDAKYIDSINYNKINGEDDFKDLLTNVSNAFKSTMEKARTKMTDAEMQKLSKDATASLADLMGRSPATFKPYEALALRHILVTSAFQLREAAIRAANSTEGIHELVFNKALAFHQAVQAKVNGVASHASQLLHSFNITAEESRGQIRQIHDMIAGITKDGDKRTKQIMKRMLEVMDDARQINRFTNKTPWEKGSDALYEIFSNSILSGPITHATNTTSNALVLSMRPTEKMFEAMNAAVRFNFKKARSDAAQSIAMMHAVTQIVGDSLRLSSLKGGVHAIETPEVLEKMHELAKQKLRPAITAEELGAKGTLGSVIDYFGKIVRLPGEALLAEDKVFKTLNYRMSINAEAAKTAMEEGKTFADTRAIYNAMRSNPNEHMITKGIDEAAYYTFTNMLSGRMGHAAQFLHNTPFRYLIPFFRTPTNIVKMGAKYSFLGSTFDVLKGDIFKLNAVGDAARARLALGTAIPAYLLANLDDDRITGPIDRRTPRGQFLASQNYPEYSIKIGDKWYSYGRIEPLKTILGMVVVANDMLHHIELTDPITQERKGGGDIANQIVTTLITPFIKTAGDNYMLPNIGSIVYMFEGLAAGNTDYALKQFDRIATSFLPNLVTQYTQQGNLWYSDPVYRQANTVLDMLKAKIPGLSQTLPARYTLWGDEQHRLPGLGIDWMSPIRTATMEPDFVDKEIERLGVNIPGVPKKVSIAAGLPSVDLNEVQQAEFAKIRGKGFDGTTLKSVVKEAMSDPEFKTAPDQYKKAIIERILNTVTENTKKYLFANDLSLQKQLNVKLEALQRIGGLK